MTNRCLILHHHITAVHRIATLPPLALRHGTGPHHSPARRLIMTVGRIRDATSPGGGNLGSIWRASPID